MLAKFNLLLAVETLKFGVSESTSEDSGSTAKRSFFSFRKPTLLSSDIMLSETSKE